MGKIKCKFCKPVLEKDSLVLLFQTRFSGAALALMRSIVAKNQNMFSFIWSIPSSSSTLFLISVIVSGGEFHSVRISIKKISAQKKAAADPESIESKLIYFSRTKVAFCRGHLFFRKKTWNEMMNGKWSKLSFVSIGKDVGKILPQNILKTSQRPPLSPFGDMSWSVGMVTNAIKCRVWGIVVVVY